jgi:hypothetical protein
MENRHPKNKKTALSGGSGWHLKRLFSKVDFPDFHPIPPSNKTAKKVWTFIGPRPLALLVQKAAIMLRIGTTSLESQIGRPLARKEKRP